MWLFDNIFADQNTATAMLDPLMTTEQKETATKTEKAILETKEVTKQAEILATPSQESDTSLLDSEVSFDIWGIDLPDFDAVTAEVSSDDTSSVWGMFLSGGKVLSAIQSEAVNAETDVSDISIGLLQGATAGSSDAIMDITPSLSTETSIESTITLDVNSDITPDPIIDLTGGLTVSEPETLVKVEEVPPTELQMDHVFTAGSSLMDMLGSVDIVGTQGDEPMTTWVLQIDPVGSPISLVTPDVMTISQPTPPSDTITEILTSTDTMIDDAALLSVIAPIPVDMDSPLHEMLREFITKLETLESGSDSLDIDTANAQAKIQAERIQLEDEYHDRLATIQREQKHITDCNIARQEEKNKLTKIIENLRAEIA